MNPDRLRALTEAYGGDPARWPAAVRAEGEAALAQWPEPPPWLAEARALDAVLDAYAAPSASAGLARRIVAGAPDLAPLWRRANAWWAGLGLAGAALAGLAAGAVLMVVAAPAQTTPATEYVYDQTVFGDLAEQGG
ncbi:MAG: hypothetical protein IT546_11410 [Caulobacteraceae bacterium]|nr:hypothetical protein [Caulobacteraceae bacterium]